MAAVYPKQYKSFPVHKNLVEDIDASHVNNLQDEVLALQQTLGINPHQATGLTMKTNTYASVGARLDAIQRGQGIPASYVVKTSDTVPGGVVKTIAFTGPTPGQDPEGLWNGRSITTNRTGWWLVSGRVMWANATGALATGPDRQINIAVAGAQVMSQDCPPIPDGNTHMHIMWQGWVTANRTLDLTVYHPLTGKTLEIENLHLAAFMLREL